MSVLGFAILSSRRPARVVIGWALFVALAGGLGACGGDDDPVRPGLAIDTSRIVLALNASGYGADALFPTGEIPLADAGHPEPAALRRFVDRIDPLNLEYRFSAHEAANLPESVMVMICKYQKGRYQIVYRLAPQDPTPADSSDRLVDKIVNSDWFRNVLLVRDDVAPHGWRVTAVSESWLNTEQDVVLPRIDEIRLRQGAGETTVPVGFVANQLTVDSLVHIDSPDPITVVARTRSATDVVLLHDALGAHRLANVGGTTFEGPLTPGGSGQRHFTVEAFSESTFVDTTWWRAGAAGWTVVVDVAPVRARPLGARLPR